MTRNVVIAFLVLIFAFFQNCSKGGVEFSKDSGASESGKNLTNGDGDDGDDSGDIDDPTVPVVPPIVEELPDDPDPNNCVTGDKLGIWIDHDEDGEIGANDERLGDIVAYSGVTTARNNYGYYSSSAHPIVGPQPLSGHINVYFYKGTDGLALTFFDNIDVNSSGNRFEWDIFTSGNNMLDQVLLSDDSSEFRRKNSAGGMNTYAAYFKHQNNTDGGVLGPFSGTNFKIRVKPKFMKYAMDAAFYSANGETFSLNQSPTELHSFIFNFTEYEDCQ